VLGLREDYQRGTDVGTNYGTASKTLFEPKANLIFEASPTSEYYVSDRGDGRHTNTPWHRSLINRPSSTRMRRQPAGL
jgi:hypothetical protein